MKKKISVDLSKRRGCSVKSCVIVEQGATDTMDAASRVVPPGKDPSQITPQQFGLEFRMNQVAQAIESFVGLDDVEVKLGGHPCLQYRNEWNNRTRAFVDAAFDHLNGVSSEELEGFRKELEGGPQPASSAAG